MRAKQVYSRTNWIKTSIVKFLTNIVFFKFTFSSIPPRKSHRFVAYLKWEDLFNFQVQYTDILISQKHSSKAPTRLKIWFSITDTFERGCRQLKDNEGLLTGVQTQLFKCSVSTQFKQTSKNNTLINKIKIPE